MVEPEELNDAQRQVIARHEFDPWRKEDIGDRIVIEGTCQTLVELGILEEVQRERKYFSAAVGMAVLRDEPYFRLTREAWPLAAKLAEVPLRPTA